MTEEHDAAAAGDGMSGQTQTRSLQALAPAADQYIALLWVRRDRIAPPPMSLPLRLSCSSCCIGLTA